MNVTENKNEATETTATATAAKKKLPLWGKILLVVVIVLAALVGLLWHQVSGRGSRQGAGVLILYGTQLIPWMLVTRCTFLYHYFPSSMFCLAALALVLGAITFALLRNDPRDLGLKPYEGKAGEGGKTADSRNADEDKPARKRHANRDLSPKAMPLLLVAMVAIGCASVGGGNYLAVLFTSEGFSAESAAAMVAISGACLTVAKLASGVVFDRVGTRNGSIAFFALYIGGTAILCLSDMGNTGLAGAGAFMFGLGMSLGTVGISIWSIELAPRGKETRTIKNFQVCYALGGFIFTFLPGFLTEAFGTYLVSYASLLAMLVVAAVIVIGVYTATDKRANPDA